MTEQDRINKARELRAAAYRQASVEAVHSSLSARSRAPALAPGPCDCGSESAEQYAHFTDVKTSVSECAKLVPDAENAV
jgi:hypothetical protein